MEVHILIIWKNISRINNVMNVPCLTGNRAVKNHKRSGERSSIMLLASERRKDNWTRHLWPVTLITGGENNTAAIVDFVATFGRQQL